MSGLVEFIIKMQDGMSTPLQKLSTHSGAANTALQKLTASNKQLTGMVASTSTSVTHLNKDFSTLNKEVDKLPGQGSKVKSFFSEIISGLPGGLLSPITLIGAGITAALNTGMKSSSEKLDFSLLLGQSAGTTLYNDISNQAPASMRDSYIQGGKQLLGAGASAGTLTSTLNRAGNISLGNNEKFTGILTALSSVAKEGKLTENSLQQLNDAGFKPLVTLNRATGESMHSLRKRFEQGKISMKDIETAMESATGKGGEFEGKLQEISNHPLNKWDAFKNKIIDTTSAFGESLIPVFGKGLDLLSVGFDWLNSGLSWTVNLFSELAIWFADNEALIYSLAGAVLGGVLAYKAYNAISMLVYLWQMRDLVTTSVLATAKGALAVVTGGLVIAQNALNAAFIASPIGWIVGGLALITGGVIYAWNKFEGFRKVIFGLWEAFKEVFNSIGNLFKQIFSPIFDAISAIKEGRWADAAKATGKLLYNMTPMGIANATLEFTQSGGFNGITSAFEKGVEKGAESWSNSQKSKEENASDNFKSDDSKLLDYIQKTDLSKTNNNTSASTSSGINAVSGGGAKSYTITIGTMWDNTSFVIQNGNQQLARDVQRVVEESVIRILSSVRGG